MAEYQMDMEVTNQEMEPDQKDGEKTVKFYLDAFILEIRKLLTESDVKKLILCYEKFDTDEKGTLSQYSENKTPLEIFDEIIRTIRNMENEHLKYTALGQAFKKMGHEKIDLILTGVALPTNDTHRDLIYKCGVDICQMIVVNQILPLLVMEGVVCEEDRIAIESKLELKGNWQAAFQLLMCLPNKKVKWYPTFMKILLQQKHQDLANLIDHELKNMWKDGKDTTVSMSYIQQPGMGPSTSSYEEHRSVVEHFMKDRQGPEPMNDLDAPPPIPPIFDSFKETEYETASEIDDSNLKEFNIKPEQLKSVLVEDKTDETNVKLIYSRQQDGVSQKSSDEESSGEEGDDEFNRQQDSSELILKDYQLELAENAVAGKNTVVCAGTGTGKTWVALHVVKEHLTRAPQGNRKVVFMARTSTLIKQQADRFKKYLPQFQTKLVTGENEESSNIGIFLQWYDILCLTPQILYNNLETGSVKSLTELSLIILDECHHTKKDEPYNNLMRKYLLEKLAKGKRDLPQVIGLTASIGVGKSHSDEDALDYMLHLFASLDVRDLSTVRRCTDSYNKETSHAVEELITMTIPRFDPCKDILLEAIDDTEDRLNDIALLIPDMIEMMTEKCPADKQSQEYTKWTVELEKMALHNVSDDETMRNIRICAIYLNVYNAALEVNTLLGPVDVMRFLAKKHEKETQRDNQKKLTHEEKELMVNLKRVQKKLAQHGASENQNVRKVCDILKKMMRKNIQESRAMVFVKARATCIALTAFLKKDFKDMDIDVQYLYGKENRGGEEGMTESVQNDTVEKFREGFYKILVATSIGIEGIDVPDCNIVLNYNLIGNEISKIQMKGRSRKKEGFNVIMGNEQHVEREKINAFKLVLMQKALKLFYKMDPKHIERKIILYQQEEMNKFRMRKEVEKIKRGRKSTDEDFEIRCRRCNVLACFTSDIRMVNCQYIVIDESFKEKIAIRPHKRPLAYDGFHKKFKMYCKKCPLDWGIVSENKGLMCRTLKLESFKLKNTKTGAVTSYKKWEDVPTRIPEIGVEDLTRVLNQVQQD